jgi:hypothetical protein
MRKLFINWLPNIFAGIVVVVLELLGGDVSTSICAGLFFHIVFANRVRGSLRDLLDNRYRKLRDNDRLEVGDEFYNEYLQCWYYVGSWNVSAVGKRIRDVKEYFAATKYRRLKAKDK